MTALVDATAGIMCFTTPNKYAVCWIGYVILFPYSPHPPPYIVHIKLLSRERLGCLQKLIYLG